MRIFTFRIRTADKNVPEVRRTLQELVQGLENIVISGITEDPDIDALPIAPLTDADYAGSFADGQVATSDKINEIVTFINGVFDKYEGAPME